MHVSDGLWRLAPAFDINPFPDKERESNTWLSEQDGPITDVKMLVACAGVFALTREQALQVLAQVHNAVLKWRKLATSHEIGFSAAELSDFAPAFEHEQMKVAKSIQ